MKPLIITVEIEGKFTKKNLINGWAMIEILSKSMLIKFGKLEDLMPCNIMVLNFSGKPSKIEGIICLNVTIGSYIQPTMFVMLHS